MSTRESAKNEIPPKFVLIFEGNIFSIICFAGPEFIDSS